MLAAEMAARTQRQLRRRLRKAGNDQLGGAITLVGGSIASSGTEAILGLTQTQVSQLTGGAFTDLHAHQTTIGGRPLLSFVFGGEIGRHLSYDEALTDFFFAVSMIRAASITGISVSVEHPSLGGYTDFDVYQKLDCDPVTWFQMAGCGVRLPGGICAVRTEFVVGAFDLAAGDEITIGATLETGEMTRAQDATVLLEVSWAE